MKIVYVYDAIYPETIGGVEKRIHEIGIRLAAAGHDVHLLGMKCWEGPDTISRDGMTLHGVCPSMDLYTGGRRSISQALKYTVRLIPHLVRIDADIVDVQNFPYFPVLAARLLSLFRPWKLVVTWHEVWGSYWSAYLGKVGIFGRLIELAALRCSTRIVAVSPLTATQANQAGYLGDIPIIPNGIAISDMQYGDTAPPSVESDLIFVGRFIPEKHPELVVEVVRLLVSSHPNLRCVMIGDGPEYAAVRQQIQDAGLEEHITCTGFVPDHRKVISLMRSSRVFLLPSEREGFGIVALEAMACGLFLVTVDHPRNAAAAHILPGCGYLSTLNPADLARGVLVGLTTTPDHGRIHRYIASHDWDQIAHSTEDYYQQIITDETAPVLIQKVPPPTAFDI